MGFFVYPEIFENNISEKVILHIDSPSKKIAYNFAPYFYKKNIHTNFKSLLDIVILGNKDLGFSQDKSQNITTIIWSDDKFLEKRISTIAHKTLKQHKVFWQDKSTQPVAVFIPNPFSENRNSWGGTVIKDTIIAFINPDTNEDIDLYDLMNHEGMHYWFGCNLICGPTWFQEGFADYYMDKIGGLQKNKQDFIAHYNKKLDQYFDMPFHALNDDEIQEKFWESSEAQRLPYLKGYLIAGQIDSIIDLDSTLRSIIKDCRNSKNGCTFSAEFFLSYLPDISEEKKNYISNLIDNFNQFPKSTLRYTSPQ